MKNKQSHITLNRMRSYSSMFSSSYFSRLLRHDDYSFIDDNILLYDNNRIGKGIDTYYDYIQYVYKQLCKKYKNEYIYKNIFINDYLIKTYGVKETIVINEFKVGNSIADLVLFNGTSKAFEIKTELDSDKRLTNQLNDYSKLFKESYVIIHESLAEKYMKENDNTGIIVLENSQTLKMHQVRKAIENVHIDSNTLMHCIRTDEYKSIINEYFGSLPNMNSFNMFDVCSELIKEIPTDDLNILFINQMKKRKSNTKNLNTFFKELRQVGLAMNITEKAYQNLTQKLNKPIQF